MKLNNIYGYGHLFGYSALDGPNRYYNDNIAMTMKEKVVLRFEYRHWIKIKFDIGENAIFKTVISDLIETDNFVITFVDNDTLIGYSPVLPEFEGQFGIKKCEMWGVDIYSTDYDHLGVRYVKCEKGYKFVIHHSDIKESARSGANYYISADIEPLVKKRYQYYENLPECKEKKYEEIYYRALVTNKVNTHTAEGKIPCMWTTPDRVPHRHMWLWDSVFHAMAISTYNMELAKNAIRAVLSQARKDGFIAHMMNPTDFTDVTQPTVLSWGVWYLYEKDHDIKFLQECVNVLDKYLEWDIKNRDKNGNGLLEWLTEPDYTICRCGESGQDNSPRFDIDDDVDAVDFSMFLANDAFYLSKIYKELKDESNSFKWAKKSEELKTIINNLMWCEEDGVYYDRKFSGEFSKILTPNCFFPMFANIPNLEQADKMVKVLTDPNLLWSEFPVATISKTHPAYSNDMWRGGVWLNLNYFIIKGLKNYGYSSLAEELRNKTLDIVNKYYQKTGLIFEFYDPEDKLIPWYCDRKGKADENPDWRHHVHSITDYNWSASFVILLINREY